jgi:mannose-1-phosphate guanylyltransferase
MSLHPPSLAVRSKSPSRSSGSTKAVILVGGPSRGTRFRPLSMELPKPLFPVAGHAIIEHCFRAVADVPDIKEVFIVGYYEESVFAPFINTVSTSWPQLSVKYLREYQALGTAGGLYHFRDVILKGRPDKLFVLNADVCSSFPLAEMLRLFNDKDAEAVMLGTRVSADAANNFGCIVSDAHTKRVLHYVEKPESHISNLINCGVYLFATECIFPAIRSAIKRRTERPRLLSYPSSENLESSQFADDDEDVANPVIRLEQDVLSDIADSRQFFVHETKDFWRQIKTAGSAVPANALYLLKAFQSGSEELAAPSANILPPVYIHPSAHVDPTAKLGPNVSIGPRVVIGAGVRVKEAIVLEDSEIKHDACIMYSIIGWHSKIGAWARVEGTPTPVTSHTTSIMRNGVKVQSITILGKECGVADEVRVQNCVCLPYKELKRVSFLFSAFCPGSDSGALLLTRCRTSLTKSSCKDATPGPRGGLQMKRVRVVVAAFEPIVTSVARWQNDRLEQRASFCECL